MDSSDSLKIDENLARFLATYDQRIDGGDPEAATVHTAYPSAPPPGERPITPLHGRADNEGSLSEVLPDDPPGEELPGGSLPGSVRGPHFLGRYELRRQLGKGGCGIVFLAYDPRLQREVALKIPRPEMLLNADAKRRLIREALAAAEFDHPNLVPVFETGELGPVCYIATAFCPGQTLAEWLDRQAFPVPVRQAARLIATVAEAVQHAHDRGVLHRDLKPNNVILQDLRLEEADEPPPGSVLLRGEHVLPRLVDFGLAKLAERGGPSETVTRQVLGTPKYMAPEQAQARREDIGPTADVYGLGVILYELTAGRAPYDGASDVEVLRQSVEGRPVPPRELRPDMPRDLEAICLKAMARSTTERYRTAIDLADDLRRFLDGRPTVARPLRWSGRALRWLRRNDQFVAIVVLALIILFLVGLGTWTNFQSRQFRDARDVALNERSRTEREFEYARQVRATFLAWRGGNARAAEEGMTRVRRAASVLMEQPEFAAECLSRLARTERLTIVCPAGPVTALAVAADGTRLASGHADGTVAVWDRATGRQLGAVQAHDGEVSHVSFACGGGFLVTLGRDADARPRLCGWDVSKEGGVTAAAGGRHALAADVTCCAVSADGGAVYAGGPRGLLMKRVLTAAAAAVVRPPIDGRPAVVALAAAQNGRRVVTAESGGTVRTWTDELEPVADGVYEFRSDVTAVAATAEGLPLVGFAGGDVWGIAPVWRPLAGTGAGRVHWVAAAPDGGFAVNGAPGRVEVAGRWGLATGDTGEVSAGAFTSDGRILFTGSADGVIRAWELSGDVPSLGVSYGERVVSAAVAPDGSAYAVATPHRVVRSDDSPFGPARRAPAVVRALDAGLVRGVELDGREVVVCDWTPTGLAESRRVAVPAGRVATAAALNPDGQTFAVGDDAGRVTVWAMDAPTPLATFDTRTGRPVPRVALSEGGHAVAAPTAAGVAVWSVGLPNRAIEIETDELSVFCFLSGERLVTAGRDGVVRVWTNSGKEDQTLFGHVGRVTGLGVSPSGRTLVSGGATGEVKFWDLRTGQELMGLRRHAAPVTTVAFSANGKVLLTAGGHEYAVWDARE
jgi:serine/threonine protein kinase/WD40 repeat protein